MKRSPFRYLSVRLFIFLISYLLLITTAVIRLLVIDGDLPILLMLLGGSVFFLLLFNFFLYLPYRRLNSAMEDYVFGYRDELVSGKDTQLSGSLDRLFDRIRDDVRTEKSLRNANRHAEFLALQNQINPHFLYNTLEGIRSDAISEGVENIAGIIESLAVYFRYTISKIDRFVTLDEELANLNNYLAIQNYRFDNRISLMEVFDSCDRSVCRNYIPKLILQPFIENSIIHGLEDKVGHGQIRILFSCTENLLLLTVEDDGVGIEEEKLKNINRSLVTVNRLGEGSEGENSGSIAIKNVNNRIKLLFGERYGVKIRSLKNFGTSVDIVLPLLDRMPVRQE